MVFQLQRYMDVYWECIYYRMSCECIYAICVRYFSTTFSCSCHNSIINTYILLYIKVMFVCKYSLYHFIYNYNTSRIVY